MQSPRCCIVVVQLDDVFKSELPEDLGDLFSLVHCSRDRWALGVLFNTNNGVPVTCHTEVRRRLQHARRPLRHRSLGIARQTELAWLFP